MTQRRSQVRALAQEPGGSPVPKGGAPEPLPGASGGKRNTSDGTKPSAASHAPEGNLGQPSLRKRQHGSSFCIRPAGSTSAHVQDGRPGRWERVEFRDVERRSLGGSGASPAQVPIPPGLDDSRPAGALPHLRCCARALRARKSLEGVHKLVTHPPELAAISLCCPEVGGCRARTAPKRAGLLLHPFVPLRPCGVRAVATPCLHGSSASMVAAAGWLSLLVTGVPREAWGLASMLARAWGAVPCGAGAQAPLCRAGVFLLTRLKLWDLEHALGPSPILRPLTRARRLPPATGLPALVAWATGTVSDLPQSPLDTSLG